MTVIGAPLDRVDGPLKVDMNILRVEAPSEFEDLGLGDRDLSVLEDGAGRVILEIAACGRRGKIGCAQRYLGLDPTIMDCITSTPQESRGCTREGAR